MPRPPATRPISHLARRPRPGLARGLTALAGVLLAAAGGCGSAPDPAPGFVRVDGSRYAAAFDAATDTLFDRGLVPSVRDRQAGVIETEPRSSAGWFTPWSIAPESSLESEATLSTLRRRARVEFAPAAFRATGGGPASGPDLLGLREPEPDSPADAETVEIRVSVFVERAHRPGRRVDTWSRRLATQSRIGRGDGSGAFEPSITWWPIARDASLEDALLREIARRTETAAGAPDPAAGEPAAD